MIKHQLIVVGGGLAGMTAAVIAAKKGIDVGVVSLTHPVRSHSTAAQGGINAALKNHPKGKEDSWERHAFDTVKGADYLADQDAVEIYAKMAPDIVRMTEHWGVPYSRFEDGSIAQRPFGGAAFPRTAFAADRTGHALMHAAFEQGVKYGVKVYEDRPVVRLVVRDKQVKGVIALNLVTGELEAYMADAVIITTGGYGQVFAKTTNTIHNTGFGMAIAFWAGVPLKDMEFVQFHPTTLYGTNLLISEAARGEGGYLINNKGERFMKKYAPEKMELGPRDIVARAIQTEINEGRGFENEYVHLDLRHLGKEKILKRLPQIRELALKFAGVDMIYEPVPIQPGQHYSMGGIDTDKDAKTIIKGLYAAGEAACVSVHGANRLGGNSLLECVVFGKIAGENAAKYIKEEKPDNSDAEKAINEELEDAKKWIEGLRNANGPNDPFEILYTLKNTMTQKVGVFRKEEDLKEAVETIRELKRKFYEEGIYLKNRDKRFNRELERVIYLQGMLDIAECIAYGALERKESRGAHYRVDYPKRDDKNWLKHSLYWFQGYGKPVKMDFKPVTITKWQPQERKY